MNKILDLRENSCFGGINSQLIRIYPGYEAKNTEFKILYSCLDGDEDKWLYETGEKIGIEFNKISYSGPFDFSVVFRLAEFITKNSIDIVHTHGFRCNILARIILTLNLAKFKTVITKHGEPGERNIRSNTYYWINKWPIKKADFVVAVDDKTYKKLQLWGVKKQKLTRIYNPAPDSAFRLPERKVLQELKSFLIFSENTHPILFLGRVTKMKGVYDLLNAFKIVLENQMSSVLLFVGDGPDSEGVATCAKKLGIENQVFLVGKHNDIKIFLSISDVLVLPSYEEGLPNVILEGIKASIPIIASNVGGIPEIIENEVSGLLFSPGDINTLAKCITRILSSPKLSAELSENAAKCLFKFSPDLIADQYLQVFKTLLK